MAADLTADTFVALIERAHTYDPARGTPVAWLYGVARHVVLDHRRTAARHLRATQRVVGRALLDADDIARLEGPPRWRRPLIAVAATGLAAATIGASLALITPATPAYAVDDTGESVTVTINRLEGAERLEADLARLGIIAHVDYTPAGTLCRPGRYTESRGVPGLGALEVSTSAGGSQSTLTLPKDALRTGETFVIESAWADDDTWLVGLGIAAGEVGECVPEPVPWAVDARPADVPAGGEPVTSTTAEDAPGSAPRR